MQLELLVESVFAEIYWMLVVKREVESKRERDSEQGHCHIKMHWEACVFTRTLSANKLDQCVQEVHIWYVWSSDWSSSSWPTRPRTLFSNLDDTDDQWEVSYVLFDPQLGVEKLLLNKWARAEREPAWGDVSPVLLPRDWGEVCWATCRIYTKTICFICCITIHMCFA